MPSFKTAAIAVIAIFVSVHAQSQYYIDPNSVDIGTRSRWCEQELATCPLLCLQLPGASSTTAANSCDATDLTFECVCGNGQSPNASEYTQTLPYFICMEWGQQCVANCGNGNNQCQAACTQQHPCGAQDPVRVNVTSTSSTMTATGTDSAAATGSSAAGTVYNGFGNAGATTAAGSTSSTSAPKSSAQTAVDLGRSYGIMVIIVGLFAGFTLVM